MMDTTSPITSTSTQIAAYLDDFRAFLDAGACAKSAGHHRAGYQSHSDQNPVVSKGRVGAVAAAVTGISQRRSCLKDFYV